MWFPTRAKIDAELIGLRHRVSRVQVRIENILEENRIFDSLLGPSLETKEFKERGIILDEALLNLQTGLGLERITVREVNVRLPNATAMVRNHESLCSMVEASRASAGEAVDRHFGT